MALGLHFGKHARNIQKQEEDAGLYAAVKKQPAKEILPLSESATVPEIRKYCEENLARCEVLGKPVHDVYPDCRPSISILLDVAARLPALDDSYKTILASDSSSEAKSDVSTATDASSKTDALKTIGSASSKNDLQALFKRTFIPVGNNQQKSFAALLSILEPVHKRNHQKTGFVSTDAGESSRRITLFPVLLTLMKDLPKYSEPRQKEILRVFGSNYSYCLSRSYLDKMAVNAGIDLKDPHIANARLTGINDEFKHVKQYANY